MYQADARKYQAARAMMDRSEPGHAIPIPATAQNVPNADNSVPTTSCKALRGMRSSGKRARAADDHECDGRRQGPAGERPRGGAERDDDYREFQTLEHYTAKRQ
jgi:hypothetical protein